MTFKRIQRLYILIFVISFMITVALNPVVASFVNVNKSYTDNAGLPVQPTSPTASLDLKVPMSLSQDNQTDTTNTTATTTTTTIDTDTTNTTTTSGLKAWRPIIGSDMYYPFALIFSILGILSTIWMIFFVETSKDRTIRERIIGTAIRLVIMSIFVGLGIHFWLLFEPI